MGVFALKDASESNIQSVERSMGENGRVASSFGHTVRSAVTSERYKKDWNAIAIPAQRSPRRFPFPLPTTLAPKLFGTEVRENRRKYRM